MHTVQWTHAEWIMLASCSTRSYIDVQVGFDRNSTPEPQPC